MDHPVTQAWIAADQDVSIQYQIHLGLWTDWTRGRILGQTLTLSRNNANLLIAFTASFVVFVGSRLWSIACLFLHRSYSTPEQRDAFHRQRQVVLRNSTSSDAGLLSLVQMYWAWRTRSAVRPLLRIAPALIISIICTVGFTVAGGFSSQIQLGGDTSGSDVLLEGSNCGTIGDIESIAQQTAYVSVTSKWVAESLNYVQQCYSANSSGIADCNYYVTQRLPGYINNTAGCPFPDSSMCKDAESNILLDTGFLNSHDHLGVNAPPEERILLRSVLQCAPLTTEGFNSPDGSNYTAYYYGEQLGVEYGNFTYEVENLDAQYQLKNDHQLSEQTYVLRELFAGTVNGTPALFSASSFMPIPQLSRNDSDLSIIFLSGYGVFSSTPIHDPWYRATTPLAQLNSTGDSGSVQVYRQDDAASPLGCVSQWQFCNAYEASCGPLASFMDAQSGAMSVFEGDAADRLDWLISSLNIDPGTLPGMLEEAQGDSLLSRQSLSSGYQGDALPDNQWQLEVTNWFAICLAFMQQTLLETVSGDGSPVPNLQLQKPETAAAKKLCRSQKIRTTKYSSFSFFGILFTYILGIAIIAISFALEPIFEFLYKRRGYKQYNFVEWTTDSTLQLQRLAYDERNGDWEHCMDAVPTTKTDFQLRRLDTRDPDHPRLLGSDSEKNTLVATESYGTAVEEDRKNNHLAAVQTVTNHDTQGPEDPHIRLAATTRGDAVNANVREIEAISPISTHSSASTVENEAIHNDRERV
ncbi:unnamed protein product [Discula destructiva]